jgi:cysteine-rich repeat protein
MDRPTGGYRPASRTLGAPHAKRLSLSLATLLLTLSASSLALAGNPPPSSRFAGDTLEPRALVPRAPVPCTGSETVLLIQDVYPWYAPSDPGDDPEGAVATELKLQGRNFCQISSADIGSTSLAGFTQIVISSAQTQAFYDNLFPGGTIHPSIDAWVQAGGILSANLCDAASGPGSGGSWGAYLFVGGVGQVATSSSDNGIAAAGHGVVADGLPCPSGNCAPLVDTAPQVDLDGWGASSHGYFTNLPPGTTVILDMPDVTGDSLPEPVAIEYPHGAGRVVAFMTTTEFRYTGGFGSVPRSRSLLANDIAYQDSIAGPALAHYTCYRARGTIGAPRFAPIAGVALADQFGPSIVDVRRPLALCNPTDKNGEDPQAPGGTNHLEGYQIKPAKGEPKFTKVTNLKVVNQFGTIFVDAVKPDRLLVPTAKSLLGPVPPLPPPTVDHFECYQAKISKGQPKFTAIRNVSLGDQFGSLLVDVRKPTRLCNPVDKNGEDPGAPDHLDHLMCYQVKPVKGAPKFTKVTPIFASNQFGSEMLDAVKRDELCVPSAKNPECGNGTLDARAGEQCDDGNTTSDDGCSSACVREFCGDGATQAGIGEQCDDGNATSGDGCSSACQTELCGDGTTQAGIGEQCDDGNATSGDGCSNTCQTEFCGDGVVQAGIGEQCDLPDDSACPGACEAAICLCGPLPFSPVTEDLTTCSPAVTDTWVFSVAAGESISVNADTVDAATAADLCFSGSCPSQPFSADDNTACTFPPPSYACPTSTFTAPANGVCTVNVTLCSGACADPATANYQLRVTRNGVDTQVGLTGDDQ